MKWCLILVHPHAHFIAAAVSIKQVKEVRSGRSTDSFKLARGEYPDERCFSVIYVEGNKFKTLDLVAMSDIDANAWVLGLKMLVKEESKSYDCQVVCHVTEFKLSWLQLLL